MIFTKARSTETNAEANGITRGMASVLSSMLSMRSKPNKDVTDNTGSHVVIKCAHASRSPLADECANLFLALCTHGAFGTRDENPFRIAGKKHEGHLVAFVRGVEQKTLGVGGL